MKKKKGYALLMVLIVIVVLSLIGAAIVSYTTSNFQLKKQYTDDYKARYIAEGGINQSYGVLMLLANESSSKEEFKSKVEDFNTGNNDAKYDELYDGNLTIELNTNPLVFNGNNMEIELTATYNNDKVIGKFNITYNDGSFLIALESKTFQ